ncbi:MAG: DNA polymerase III subunit epsilon [Methylohalobius sp. ZOD2]
MRQIVLDTETTGLEPEEGHRIIEIGCVELIDRRLTGNRFHEYLDPEREIDREAIEVHGIDNAFLADKPRFADIAEDFLRFIQGSEVVIHNAPFDVGFINAELKRLGPQLGRMEDHASVLDTLVLAKRMHPGQRNSLDALCKRYQIDNRHRDLHGALLDAEILASVYLAMTGGQITLGLEGDSASQFSEAGAGKPQLAPRKIDRRNHAALKVVSCPPEDLAAHRERLEAIDKASGGNCLWHKP